MSSAKAALESDTRTLAWEAGQKYGIRVNTISAGPLKSRAASAIGKSGEKSFIDYAIDYSYNNAPLRRVSHLHGLVRNLQLVVLPFVASMHTDGGNTGRKRKTSRRKQIQLC